MWPARDGAEIEKLTSWETCREGASRCLHENRTGAELGTAEGDVAWR